MMSHTEFYGPVMASEKVMRAFGQICLVAEHGVSYDKNWEALGYDCPENGFLSFLFSNVKTKISKILFEELLDTIVEAGLHVIGSSSFEVQEYLKWHKQQLKSKDLRNSLVRIDGERFQRRISNKGIADRFRNEGLPTDDAERLDSVLKMIGYSYSELFSEMFKDFKEY